MEWRAKNGSNVISLQGAFKNFMKKNDRTQQKRAKWNFLRVNLMKFTLTNIHSPIFCTCAHLYRHNKWKKEVKNYRKCKSQQSFYAAHWLIFKQIKIQKKKYKKKNKNKCARTKDRFWRIQMVTRIVGHFSILRLKWQTEKLCSQHVALN